METFKDNAAYPISNEVKDISCELLFSIREDCLHINPRALETLPLRTIASFPPTFHQAEQCVGYSDVDHCWDPDIEVDPVVECSERGGGGRGGADSVREVDISWLSG